MKKLLVLLLAVAMVVSLFAGCSKKAEESSAAPEESQATEESEEEAAPAEESEEEAASEEEATEPAEEEAEEEPAEEASGTVTDLPRNETLYFGGQQYGTINSWNPVGSNQNNAMAISSGTSNRCLMFEPLYLYNFMDGSLTGLLADGDYQWNDDMTEMTVKIKAAAHWSDGSDLTANDYARTWEISKEIGNGIGAGYQAYIDTVEAVDDKTVVIKTTLTDDGKPTNPLLVLDFICSMQCAQAAWLDTLYERNGGDAAAILNDKAEDVVWSGPYHRYYDDDQKVILIRDDNYWGQDASMWGSLPKPKYIAHNIYSGNDATEVAFRNGEIDVNQQFLANIQNLWLEDGLEISTYYDEAPYGVCLSMPTAWFNFNLPVLAENPALRKAIVMATDYDSIIANAMTNQSPTFKDVPSSLMNPTEGEQALYDHDNETIKALQAELAGNDIEGANKVLDEAGLLDTDGDGYREWNGEKIHLNAVCPDGWSDWQAAIEIVAAAGEKIGIEIVSEYPTWDTMQNVFTDGTQTDYAIFMWTATGAAPSSPWARYRATMSSEFLGMQNNWSGNWGQYKNEEADQLIQAIPLMTDEAEIKAAYTRLNEIYLTDLPSFALMYRPQNFHAVYEGVWTNFGSGDDGRNIPPGNCTDGYAIRDLYEIELAE